MVNSLADWENAEVVDQQPKTEFKDEDKEEVKKPVIVKPPPKKVTEIDYDELYQKKTASYAQPDIKELEKATANMTIEQKQEYLSKQQDKASIQELFKPVILSDVESLAASIGKSLAAPLSLEKSKKQKDEKIFKIISDIINQLQPMFKDDYYEKLGKYFKAAYNFEVAAEKEKKAKKKEAPKKALYEQKDIVKDLFASKCNEKQPSVFNEKEDFM